MARVAIHRALQQRRARGVVKPRVPEDPEVQIRRAFESLEAHKRRLQERSLQAAAQKIQARAQAVAVVEGSSSESEPTTVAVHEPERVVRRLPGCCKGQLQQQRTATDDVKMVAEWISKHAVEMQDGLVRDCAVVRASLGECVTLDQAQQADARAKLHPVKWAPREGVSSKGAEGGSKSLLSLADGAFDEHVGTEDMRAAREKTGPLVMLVSRVKASDASTDYEIAAEIVQTLKAAVLGIGMPVVSATMFRLSASEKQDVARAWGLKNADESALPKGQAMFSMVMPRGKSLHSVLRRNAAMDRALFNALQQCLQLVSSSKILLCDSKPANFLVMAKPTRVFAIDFDRLHIFDPLPLPDCALLLLHNLLIAMHVVAENQSSRKDGHSYAEWTVALSDTIRDLYSRVRTLSAHDEAVRALLMQRFVPDGVLRPRCPVPVMGRVADKLQGMLASYMFEFERYSKTELCGALATSVAQESPIVLSLVSALGSLR